MTLNECQSVCMGREPTVVPSIPDDCTLPIRAGRCGYNLTRYGYDIVQKKCVEFVYGGCGANKNNFRRLSDCQAVCEGGVPTPDPTPSPKGVCSLPIEIGPCKAYIPSYAYNNELKKCVLFIYGGCEGNENKFETLKDCQSACEKEGESTTAPSVVPEVCTLPIKSGPCLAFFPKYAYDSSQKRCVRFIYGGCQGNGNNFDSLEECQSTCMGVEPTPSPESTPTTGI
ncbi:Kunitz/Bovine pancreatic trypsin inhibitor domain protein [Oesophagostomum dentatum]|uniref:Kunitz/Bovine pancreatic trypsin inhibitor domain protein n=1 Tax=Oesophagostomum dentatum TaxID=61180 RepID=A0A0B1SGV0_OESDE|nr:Kunitz/Bovine pancreatic trypsin inhibitor domain protein [Oesophagostomum dentatum]